MSRADVLWWEAPPSRSLQQPTYSETENSGFDLEKFHRYDGGSTDVSDTSTITSIGQRYYTYPPRPKPEIGDQYSVYFTPFSKWRKHMEDAHTTNWARRIHSPQVWYCDVSPHEYLEFGEQRELEHHLKNERSNDLDSNQLQRKLTRNVLPSPQKRNVCPLCNQDILKVYEFQEDSLGEDGTTNQEVPDQKALPPKRNASSGADYDDIEGSNRADKAAERILDDFPEAADGKLEFEDLQAERTDGGEDERSEEFEGVYEEEVATTPERDIENRNSLGEEEFQTQKDRAKYGLSNEEKRCPELFHLATSSGSCNHEQFKKWKIRAFVHSVRVGGYRTMYVSAMLM
ncbi:hypothetical protein CHU98_g1420 [Xylaria longipes]|nr:hypothetical protein CHU98_g1420 [Xylaria longipes]